MGSVLAGIRKRLDICLYVPTIVCLSLSCGPTAVLPLYALYTGYSFLQVAALYLPPTITRALQVCMGSAGIALAFGPLSSHLLTAPLSNFLLVLPPLLCLIEGYQFYRLVAKTSLQILSLRWRVDDEVTAEGMIDSYPLILSLPYLGLSAYLHYHLDLSPLPKYSLLAAAAAGVVFETTACRYMAESPAIIAFCYAIITVVLAPVTPTIDPTLLGTPPQTLFQAVLQFPRILSSSECWPSLKYLLAPMPLAALASGLITVSIFLDHHLGSFRSFRILDRWLTVSLLTSHIVLAVGQGQPEWLAPFTLMCRGAEVVVMIGFFLRYRFGFATELKDYPDLWEF